MTFGTPLPEGLSEPIAPYSPVVVSDDLVLLSGQVPFDAAGALVSSEFEPQARRVFENLGSCLAAAGCGFEHVLKVNAYLASFDDFAAYNEFYREYFAPPYPARTTVQAGLYGFRIEVEALARLPRSAR
jgi:2-iminobutanoate/2-iminopropanoate deaminase